MVTGNSNNHCYLLPTNSTFSLRSDSCFVCLILPLEINLLKLIRDSFAFPANQICVSLTSRTNGRLERWFVARLHGDAHCIYRLVLVISSCLGLRCYGIRNKVETIQQSGKDNEHIPCSDMISNTNTSSCLVRHLPCAVIYQLRNQNDPEVYHTRAHPYSAQA